MKAKYRIQASSTSRLGRITLILALGMVTLASRPVLAQITFAGKRYSVFAAQCSRCGRPVSVFSKAGESCPHCSAYWSSERNTYHSVSSTSDAKTDSSDKAKKPERSDGGVVLKPSSRRCWPRYAHSLFGFNHLTFENHTGAKLWVGLRLGASGYDMKIAAHGKGHFNLPAGKYQIYVFRFDSPDTLFEAGEITMANTERKSLCLMPVQY